MNNSNDYMFDSMGRYRRENFAATVHYNYGGNTYYQIPATGFCGAKAGVFTHARGEITCKGCLDAIA
jgi:hypothetical protein